MLQHHACGLKQGDACQRLPASARVMLGVAVMCNSMQLQACAAGCGRLIELSSGEWEQHSEQQAVPLCFHALPAHACSIVRSSSCRNFLVSLCHLSVHQRGLCRGGWLAGCFS